MKSGYKRTEIGVIPEDWEAVPLGQRCIFRTGPFGSALHKSDYTQGAIPLINPMHIVDGEIVPSDSMTITVQSARKLSDFLLRQGDIVIGRRGDMGRCAVVSEKEDGWLCGTGSMIVRPGPNADPNFFQYILSTPEAISRITDTSVGSTMINLNQGTLKGLIVQAPSLLEQRAIAAALSDADALIASLDALIAKKRDLKQAAMQQLLTGKTRLPGFKGEWRRVTLGELGSFSKGRGIRRDQVKIEGLPCVRYGEIYTHHQDIVREYNSFINRSVALESQRLQPGDLLFAGSGETAEEIGKCVAFIGTEEAYAGGDIVIFSPRTDNPSFLGYLMNHSSIVQQKSCMGQGDAVVHISAKNLATISFDLPESDEQAMIADILIDMDVDLSALEAKRDKAIAVKQGMAQELLTGRIRLV